MRNIHMLHFMVCLLFSALVCPPAIGELTETQFLQAVRDRGVTRNEMRRLIGFVEELRQTDPEFYEPGFGRYLDNFRTQRNRIFGDPEAKETMLRIIRWQGKYGETNPLIGAIDFVRELEMLKNFEQGSGSSTKIDLHSLAIRVLELKEIREKVGTTPLFGGQKSFSRADLDVLERIRDQTRNLQNIIRMIEYDTAGPYQSFIELKAAISQLPQKKSPAFARAETKTEYNLIRTTYYPALTGGSPRNYLQSHIERLRTKMASAPHTTNDVAQRVGDAYHWLGHIYEQLHRHEEAHVFFDQAIRFYRESNLEGSPRVNGLGGLGHTAQHIHILHAKSADPNVTTDLLQFAAFHFAQSAKAPGTFIGTNGDPGTMGERCEAHLRKLRSSPLIRTKNNTPPQVSVPPPFTVTPAAKSSGTSIIPKRPSRLGETPRGKVNDFPSFMNWLGKTMRNL